MRTSAIALRLPPCSERVPRSGHECFGRGSAVAPRYDLHRQSSSVGISGSFAVDDELFDHADEQLDASLTLASADHAGTTDLVEDRRRALIA
jgi:hypothetical protein